MIHIYRYPNLELRWLPNSFLKSIGTMPMLIHDYSETEAGGYYIHPAENVNWIIDIENDVLLSGKKPIIATAQSTTSATLAHEMRHVWQFERFGDNGSSKTQLKKWSTVLSYKDTIIKYFTTYWTELDALRFELKYGDPEDYVYAWVDWLEAAGCRV